MFSKAIFEIFDITRQKWVGFCKVGVHSDFQNTKIDVEMV